MANNQNDRTQQNPGSPQDKSQQAGQQGMGKDSGAQRQANPKDADRDMQGGSGKSGTQSTTDQARSDQNKKS
ncbi:hypothetical protein AB4059_06140 [Lysobacter sp. 2RAF19]